MKKPVNDLKAWIEKEFFHAVPVFIAALDRQLNIVYANEAFKNKFGEWEDKKCFDVYKTGIPFVKTVPAALLFQTLKPA